MLLTVFHRDPTDKAQLARVAIIIVRKRRLETSASPNFSSTASFVEASDASGQTQMLAVADTLTPLSAQGEQALLTSPGGTLSGESKVQGINLDLVGTLPLTERFAALARIGVQQAWSKSSFTGAGAAVAGSNKRNDTNAKYGLGLQYEINPAMWVRGGVERYRIKNAVGQRNNVDVVSVSLVLPMGRAPEWRMAAAPSYVAPAPAPVAMAPAVVAVAPPPAPVPVPVVPAVQRVSFSADTLFGFDKSTVRPEARAALDDFSNKLSGTTCGSISVEGHTDRKGSAAYNQALSSERANSVKDCLVINGKLDPTKISAGGKDESAPVTKVEDCSDKLPRAQLITCLQPDRRVEVEVTGAR